MPWTSSESLMYVQFTSCVYEVNLSLIAVFESQMFVTYSDIRYISSPNQPRHSRYPKSRPQSHKRSFQQPQFENYTWLRCNKDTLRYTEAVAQRCYVKQKFLKNLQNSQENICNGASSLIKLQAETCNFTKREAIAQVFSSEFCKIFKNCVRYFFASLFYMYKREPLRKNEKYFLFPFESSLFLR